MRDTDVTFPVLKQRRSSLVRLLQSSNIPFIVVACEVSKSPNVMSLRAKQPLNTSDMPDAFSVLRPVRSTLVSDVQSSNRLDTSAFSAMLKLPNFTSCNDSQSENIDDIFLILFRLRPLRSMLVRLLQPENKYSISSSLLLTEFPKVTSPNALQPINIEDMSVTLSKTMLLRSRLVRLLHPLNIRERSSAFSVLKLLRFRSARFSQSANIHSKSVAFLGLKPLRSSSVNASQSKNI